MKTLTTQTDSGLEHRIYLLERPLKKEEVTVRVKPAGNMEKLLDQHRQLYADSLIYTDWREGLLALDEFDAHIDPRNLEFVTTTSYEAQAVRKGKTHGILPLGVDGLILTADNKFVYGIRNGLVDGRKVCMPAPAESISVNHAQGNSIFAAFYAGLIEELGLEPTSVSSVVLLGLQNDPEITKGIDFVFFGKTLYTSSGINEMHRNAFNVYQKQLDSGRPELEARKSIKGAGFPNTDAWESERLVFIENGPSHTQEIINSKRIFHANREYPVLCIGIGALILYAKHYGQ